MELQLRSYSTQSTIGNKHFLAQIKSDLKEFVALLNDPHADLYKPFAHGDGQHLLREAMLIVDHTSYHTGEIIVLRRLLGAWKT